ncbi:MAG: ABC transporter substrate-binding protein [Deltaproteobacteria bacterium]|nr:ABC transporter substrate-binding protein [Deltaproteobacteria bacterium]
MKRFQHIATLTAILVFICGSAAAQMSPTAFIKAKDKKLAPLLSDTAKNRTKIIGIVNKMLDFPTLCRASLGKYWEERTETERKDFTETLQALIEKNLINRLKDTKDRKISYESESVKENSASVVTLIAVGDDPRAEKTEIKYKLKKKGRGWAVVDMATDGVSLVNNYRSQFNKIITEEGWDILIKKMKDKLAE